MHNYCQDFNPGSNFLFLFSKIQLFVGKEPKKLDISGFNATSVDMMSQMFDDCVNLQEIVLGSKWSFLGACPSSGYYSILPTPDSTYIPGADGNWYNEDSKPFTAKYLQENYDGSTMAGTYYASKSLIPTSAALSTASLDEDEELDEVYTNDTYANDTLTTNNLTALSVPSSTNTETEEQTEANTKVLSESVSTSSSDASINKDVEANTEVVTKNTLEEETSTEESSNKSSSESSDPSIQADLPPMDEVKVQDDAEDSDEDNTKEVNTSPDGEDADTEDRDITAIT
jgi:hypothetical protein